MSPQRVILPERLDHTEPAAARNSLNDLIRINRYLGGYHVLRRIFSEVVRSDERFSVLDVGAASGDMGAELRRAFRDAEVTSFDYKADHLALAGSPKVVGDAFRLPFRDHSFDVVFSSLFLHHFPDEQAVELLANFARVARRAVLAIDLDRGPLGYYFLPMTKWLFGWDAITLYDGPLSVQAAFKRDELLVLARKAGLENAVTRTHRPWGRVSLVALTG